MCAVVATSTGTQMDVLAVICFLASVAWVMSFTHQRDGLAFRILLIVTSAFLSGFAFLQTGCWPLGIVLAVFTTRVVTGWMADHEAMRGWIEPANEKSKKSSEIDPDPSRLERLFGTRH